MPAYRLRPFWSAIAIHAGLAPDDVQGAMDFHRDVNGVTDVECFGCRQRFDAYRDELFTTTIEDDGDERVGGSSSFCPACAPMTGIMDGKKRPES
jgi:hypothetical protein